MLSFLIIIHWKKSPIKDKNRFKHHNDAKYLPYAYNNQSASELEGYDVIFNILAQFNVLAQSVFSGITTRGLMEPFET
jgi:hypothetical protein